MDVAGTQMDRPPTAKLSIYRIDLLDEQGNVDSSGQVACRNDHDALRAAAWRIGRHSALEIWQHTRVVGRVTAAECGRTRADR
jgi:hypothetical protein